MLRVTSLSKTGNVIFSGGKSASDPSGRSGDDSVRVFRETERGVRKHSGAGGGRHVLHHVRYDHGCWAVGSAVGGFELVAEYVRAWVSNLHGSCDTKGLF